VSASHVSGLQIELIELLAPFIVVEKIHDKFAACNIDQVTNWSHPMNLGHHVESYRFWDIVTQWARETLQHEHIIARVMAKGVIRDGLRVQSVDPKWMNKGTFELRGLPYVGYVAKDGQLPIFIRASALNHLRDIVENAAVPNPDILFEEFVMKQDFRTWLDHADISPPLFWFDAN
jgi:hypothetical protein